jgi:hypothetical protein
MSERMYSTTEVHNAVVNAIEKMLKDGTIMAGPKAVTTTDNEPFGRQRCPVTLHVTGQDQRDVDEVILKFTEFAERSGDETRRLGNTFKIYPRAVND